MKQNQSGYALLMVLGILVLMTSLISGSFVSMTRHQRETTREHVRVRTEWAVRALYEAAVYRFQRFVVENARAPNSEELGEIATAAKALASIDFPRTNFNLQMTYDSRSADTADDYFLIDAQAVDQQTSSKSEEAGYVHTTTGSILDFGLFYDGDLEISPGETMEIQGPIFANGNIYLMTGLGNSLTLKEPDNPVQFTSDYVLRSAGSIFFYFKPVIARNYFLEESETYQNGAASYYSDPLNYGTEATWSTLRPIETNGETRLVGYPKLYYFKNHILSTEWRVNSMSGCMNRERQKDASKPAPDRRSESQLEDFCKTQTHHIYFQGRGLTKTELPYSEFYYHSGDTWEYFAGVTSYTSHYFNKNNYTATESANLSVAFDLDNRFFFDHLSGLQFQTGEDAVTASSAVNPSWADFKAQVNDMLGSSGDVDKVADGLPRQKITLTHGANNHDVIETVDNRDVLSGGDSPALKAQKLQSKADIVVRCDTAGCAEARLVYRTREGNDLEPLRSDYAVNEKLFKLKPQRNLRLAKAVALTQDSLRNPSNLYVNAYFQSVLMDMSGLTEALNECKRWHDEDDDTSSSVIAESDGLCQLNITDGLIVHIETKSFNSAVPGSNNEGVISVVAIQDGGVIDDAEGVLLQAPSGVGWPIRQVVIENADQLLSEGVTVVTNGWMWTRGDFNIINRQGDKCFTVESDSDDMPPQWPLCESTPANDSDVDGIPPAALFSDSFGVMSSEGMEVDAFSSGSPTISKAPQNVMLNATVITGYLPSMLERAYPDCKGLASPAEMAKCGGWGAPGTDYVGAPCPAGLDSEGNPVDMSNCNYYFKKETGVFYFRRYAILRDWLTIIKHEINEYEAFRARFKYTLADGVTVLDALRFPDHPNWFTGAPNSTNMNNMTIAQQLTEIQADIDAMQSYMNSHVDIDPNDASSYQILDGLRSKYGRFSHQLPTIEGYLVQPPDVGAVRGALYGQLGNDSTNTPKNPNVGDLAAYAYKADKTIAPAYTFFGHPVYYPGVAGSVGDIGGYFSTPNYGSSWIVFDPELSAESFSEDAKKQKKFQNQVKLLWCGSSNPPADFNDILNGVPGDPNFPGCTEAERTNQIYWRMFSFDFNHFPHHWTGIPFYAATSYSLGVGQQAGDANSKAVTGFAADPVDSSPLESNLQPIGAPGMCGSGSQSIRIQYFYQANMVGTSAGSGKWVLHPGTESTPPWQEYIPDPNASARFYNLRDTGRGGGVQGFLRPYYYNAAKPDASWNRLGFAHGRQYPLYDIRYSGGWENLINFQEQWTWNTSCENNPNLGVVCQQNRQKFYFRGSQAAPWKSEEMRRIQDEKGKTYDTSDPTKPPQAFWRTDYYTAPQRYYDYDERLSIGLMHRPPGMLNTVSVSRAKRLPKVLAEP